MKISFAHLGNEECKVCAHFKLHTSETRTNSQSPCLFCQKYEKHKLNYQTSRTKSNYVTTHGPIQSCHFLSLHNVYNESFVPLGSSNKDGIPFPVLWTETMSGRKLLHLMPENRRQFWLDLPINYGTGDDLEEA